MYLLWVFVAMVLQTVTGNHVTSTRIVEAEVTSIHKYPHQASLQQRGQLICAATIVKSKYLLTAAHCLRNINTEGKRVHVGVTAYHEGDEFYTVESFTIHPLYNSVYLSNMDIGIIKVSNTISFDSRVQPIPIIPEGQREPEHGEMVTVIGWGASELNPSDLSSRHLRAIRIPVIGRDRCIAAYKKYEEVAITENMVCAGGSSKGVQKGDSGGPLINDNNQLVGIVSWGRKEGILGFPSVFTNIASPAVRNFVMENTVL